MPHADFPIKNEGRKLIQSLKEIQDSEGSSNLGQGSGVQGLPPIPRFSLPGGMGTDPVQVDSCLLYTSDAADE